MLIAVVLIAAARMWDERGNRPPDAPPWPQRSTVPSAGIADRIEAQLNGARCIGNIHGWQRSYWYPAFTDRNDRFWIDFGKVVAIYRDADGGSRTDRRIMRANPITAVEEDGAVREVIVEYKMSSGKAKVTYCGPAQGD